MRKVFLENLPIIKSGTHKGNINWNESINNKVFFIYDDIKGEIEIIDYVSKGQYLTIKYLDCDLFRIKTGGFMQCKLGQMLNNCNPKLQVKIGDIFDDNGRNLLITDEELRKDKKGHNIKYYKYHCNICNWDEGFITKRDLLRGNGCSCCRGFTVVKDINSIYTTNPELIKYFVDINDAYENTIGTHKKVICRCPDCGTTKEMSINNLYKQGFSCSKCSDSISFSEKVMHSILEQLELDFKTQLNKTTFKWCDKYKYDFYFEYNNEEYVVETHGGQHYQYNSSFSLSLEETQANDKFKKELALQNGIKEENYIVIDCRKTNLNWIKQNILQSRLKDIFDLSKIDWIKCNEFASNNLVKLVCEYWNNKKEEETTMELIKYFKLSNTTINRYLKIGESFGWCKYSPKEEQRKVGKKMSQSNKKIIEIFKDGNKIAKFNSTVELVENIEKTLGIQLSKQAISEVCLGRRKSHKGFQFKYAS